MKTVTRSHEVFISAPPEMVFEYVSDLTRHPEWSGGALEVESVTPGPVAIGKEYISRGEVLIQKERPNRVRVSQYDPPHRFAFMADDPDFGAVTHKFTFTRKTGGVLVRRDMTLHLHPAVALLFRLIVYPLVGSPSMERAMASMKAKLEQKVT